MRNLARIPLVWARMQGMTLRSQAVLAGLAIAAGILVIGCGGSGGDGGMSTSGTLTTTTNGNPTNGNPTNGNPTTGVPTTPGVLPQNTILFAVNDPDNGFLRQIKPDGTGGSVLSSYSPNVIAVAPDPVATNRYVFVGTTTTGGPYKIYSGTNTTDPAASVALASQTYALVTDLALSPDGKSVFFVGAPTDNDPLRLYKIAGGAAPVALDFARRISVSPVGQKIAYSKDNASVTGTDIYVRDYSPTSTPTRVTTAVGENSYPAFNRTGTKLVYSSNAGGTAELYVANPDGTGIKQITTTPTLDELAAAFNDDGTKIAYSALSSNLGETGIYVAKADGTTPTLIAADPAIDADVYWTSLLGRGRTKMPVPDGFVLRRIAPVKR